MAEKPNFELEESWVFGMLWPKRLRVFGDRIEVTSTELMREIVETVEFGEIEAIVVGGRGPSSSLLVRRRRDKPVLMRGVDQDAAHEVKTFVEERMSLASFPRDPDGSSKSQSTTALVRKLTDLRDAGVLSSKEFEAKRKSLEEES